MISKETQYLIYSGSHKDDFTGWRKVESGQDDGIELWTLDLGDGYFMERVIKTFQGLFSKKKVKFNYIRTDRTIEDLDGDYKDIRASMLVDVRIVVMENEIKFETKNNSFVMLSREPVDWNTFEEGKPTSDKENTENWSSFYH